MPSSSEALLQQLPAQRAKFPYRVGIIGGGRAGGALAQAVAPVVSWIVARSPEQRAQLRDALPHTPIVGTLEEIERLPEVVVIAVSDRAIATLALAIARRFTSSLSGTIVVHLSGVHLAQEVAVVEQFGGLAASAHPFTMIPTPDPTWLFGAVWGIEGNREALPVVEHFVREAGGVPYLLGDITADQKALYHVAAVLASNVVTDAIRAAVEAADAAGIPPALFLPPILRATMENAIGALRAGQPIARTGPIQRADVETIERHLVALGRHRALQRYYCLCAQAMGGDAAGQTELVEILERFCSH